MCVRSLCPRHCPSCVAISQGVSLRQGRRPYMEDRHVIVDDVRSVVETGQGESHAELPDASAWSPGRHYTLLGLFDGHGGAHTAEFAARELPRLLMRELGGGDPCSALTAAFHACDQEFIAVHRTRTRMGTTALAVLYDWAAHALHVANAGDTRAVLCRGDAAVRLTEDHKPDGEEEKARIRAAGGIVGADPDDASRTPRVYTMTGGGGLAVSRALGDAFLKNIPGRPPVAASSLVIATPDVETVALALPGDGGGPWDHFVIIATDGVWDVMSDQKACDVVKVALVEGGGPKGAADALVSFAHDCGSIDNLSAIVLLFGAM